MKWGCQKAKMARIAHQGDIGVTMQIATGTNDLLSQGTKRTSDNQMGLILENAATEKLRLDIDHEVCMSQIRAWHIVQRTRSEWIDCDHEDEDVDVMISNQQNQLACLK